MNPPCGWPTNLDPNLYGYGGDDAIEKALAAENTAAYILWAFTGQRFGPCEVTVSKPPKCSCVGTCSGQCELALPGPVSDVSEVLVNGETYDNWVFLDGRIVSPTPWPADVVVSYLRGLDVPPGADRAVRELAQQLAYSDTDESKCRLPSNLVSRTRNGDTVTMGEIPEGRTNIPMVDLWIQAVSSTIPQGRTWSPDVSSWVVDYA